MRTIAIALVLTIGSFVVADRHDEIAARALAEAIHRPRASVFIPDKKTECLCTIGGFCRCAECKCVHDLARRRPTVVDSYDLGEQQHAEPFAAGNRVAKAPEKKNAPAKKAAPKRVVRRVIQEPVYYTMPGATFAPGPSFGGFGGGFGGGSCGPGG